MLLSTARLPLFLILCLSVTTGPVGTADESPPSDDSTTNSTEPDKKPSNVAPPTVKRSEFGSTAEQELIEQFTLANHHGIVVQLISYGATVVSVRTPDRNGQSANIVLGHSSLEHWLANSPYFGCTVGRYANRIAGGVFGLDDNVYSLAANNGDNHLHGGEQGFHKVLWKGETSADDAAAKVVFSRISPDREDGYPGTLTAKVTYTLTNENELRIDYEATTDKPTVVNLTNHCYWNLTGDPAKKNILKHFLTLNCDLFLPVDETSIPTGDLSAVADTSMNFVAPHAIGQRIDDVPGGYDHCYVVNRAKEDNGLVKAARVADPESGRVMEIFTTEPGIQLYSGNFLDGGPSHGGFKKNHAFCLETQHFPDSPNQTHFPSTTLNPGETYKSTTVHKFSTL